MKSYAKSILHTILSLVVFYLPIYLSGHPDISNVTVGAILTFLANWATSQFIPTTTGASAKQNIG